MDDMHRNAVAARLRELSPAELFELGALAEQASRNVQRLSQELDSYITRLQPSHTLTHRFGNAVQVIDTSEKENPAPLDEIKQLIAWAADALQGLGDVVEELRGVVQQSQRH